MTMFSAEDQQNILKFVKKDVTDGMNRSKLAKTDLNKKENILNPKKIDVGFTSSIIIETLEKDKKGFADVTTSILRRVSNVPQSNGRESV